MDACCEACQAPMRWVTGERRLCRNCLEEHRNAQHRLLADEQALNKGKPQVPIGALRFANKQEQPAR